MIVNLAILLEWIRVRLSSGSFFNYVDNVGRGTENVNMVCRYSLITGK